MIATSSFVPLRVHSHGSLLYGVASPEALVERALEQGLHSLALTDRDNLYLAVRFYQAALTEGLQPLLGCLITTRDHEALIICVDRRGFANLCELLTAVGSLISANCSRSECSTLASISSAHSHVPTRPRRRLAFISSWSLPGSPRLCCRPAFPRRAAFARNHTAFVALTVVCGWACVGWRMSGRSWRFAMRPRAS